MAQGDPVHSRQWIPFRTRRSSTRGTPRGLFGSRGAMIDQSKSITSYRGALMLSRSAGESAVRSEVGKGVRSEGQVG